MTVVSMWVTAFALTLALEWPVTWWALRDAVPPHGRLKSAALALLPSTVTHPVVWFVWPSVFRLAPMCHVPGLLLSEPCFQAYTVVAEIFALVAEAFILKFLGVRRYWLVSFAANACSYLTGLLLQRAGLI
jgi:hypothetical protein